MSDAFWIKDGYVARLAPDYAADPPDSEFQPDVYTLAGALGGMIGAGTIIDVGCGSAFKLAPLNQQFHVVGIDYGANLAIARARGFGLWLEANLEHVGVDLLPRDLLRRAVLICADVIEHLVDPSSLLRALLAWLEYSPVALLSTPARDSYYPDSHNGPPENPAHVREWARLELVAYLEALGFAVPFAGLTRAHPTQGCQTTIAVLRGKR